MKLPEMESLRLPMESFKRGMSFLFAIAIASQSGSVLLASMLLFVSPSHADSHNCTSDLLTPGYTSPSGDIIVEHGKPLTIFCILNDETFSNPMYASKNASDLAFFRDTEMIESEYITIVNQTTIKMTIEKPPPSVDTYYCKLLRTEVPGRSYDIICMNVVHVALRPQEPDNFSCISYNWKNLTCTWEPKQHYVHTNYSVLFSILRSNRYSEMLYPEPENDATDRNSAFLRHDTGPHYREQTDFFAFSMIVQNALGRRFFGYRLNHLANVIPDQPCDLSVLNHTSKSGLLDWRIPPEMWHFFPGLHHRIMYRSLRDEAESWKTIDITNDLLAEHISFNLTGLHPSTEYTVRVMIRSALAVNNEQRWSQFSEISFKTDTRPPGSLMRLRDIGSLKIVRNNNKTDIHIHIRLKPFGAVRSDANQSVIKQDD